MAPDKKRKRQEQNGDRPAKKVNTVATVRYIADPDNLGPVIVETPGLVFPSEVVMDGYQTVRRNPPAGVPQPPTQLLLQTDTHSRLEYVGREEKDGTAESRLKNYIGVYDPATGQMQLMEAKKLVVRGTLHSELAAMRKRERTLAEKLEKQATAAERRMALSVEFGSRKAKKAILERDANAMFDSKRGDAPAPLTAAQQAIMAQMAEATKDMPSTAQHAAVIDENKPRPIANTAAVNPHEAYPIETIVGPALMSAITVKDWVDAAASGEALTVASRYVAKRMTKLARSKDSKDVKKLKVLRFILLGVNMLGSLKGGGRAAKSLPRKDKMLEIMGCSSNVLDLLQQKFASADYNMTRWHVDYLISHILAAALIVDDYEVDLNDLRDDLRLDNKQTKQYFLELGCRVKVPTDNDRAKLKITKAEAVNHNIAQLRIPLVFPKAARGAAKKKR